MTYGTTHGVLKPLSEAVLPDLRFQSNRIVEKINEPVKVAAMMIAEPVTPVRARFVLVVSALKPVLRAGDRARGWLQS